MLVLLFMAIAAAAANSDLPVNPEAVALAREKQIQALQELKDKFTAYIASLGLRKDENEKIKEIIAAFIAKYEELDVVLRRLYDGELDAYRTIDGESTTIEEMKVALKEKLEEAEKSLRARYDAMAASLENYFETLNTITENIQRRLDNLESDAAKIMASGLLAKIEKKITDQRAFYDAYMAEEKEALDEITKAKVAFEIKVAELEVPDVSELRK